MATVMIPKVDLTAVGKKLGCVIFDLKTDDKRRSHWYAFDSGPISRRKRGIVQKACVEEVWHDIVKERD